jgi:hypothetical protein
VNKILHVKLNLAPVIDAGEQELRKEIASKIKENELKFLDKMQAECSRHGYRAQYLESSLSVDAVDLYGHGGGASVSYSWDEYNGCDDMNRGDEEEECWGFELEGEWIIFNLEIPDLLRDDEI